MDKKEVVNLAAVKKTEQPKITAVQAREMFVENVVKKNQDFLHQIIK